MRGGPSTLPTGCADAAIRPRNGRRTATARSFAAGLAGVLALAGCAASSGTASTAQGDERLAVVAAVYPAQYLLEQIGGDRVRVTTLATGGGEAHDHEPTPQDVAAIAQASLTAYVGGLQPAVDRSIADEGGDRALDLAPVADLGRPAGDHAGETSGEDADEDGHGATDPHFWLDPTRYAKAGKLVADRLATLDPDRSLEYRDRAERFGQAMTALDGEFAAGLKTCATRNLVTSHTAFAYLADRYGLVQIGIGGIDPEGEPSPAELARVADRVRQAGVRTVYAESAAARPLAETVAREAGARVALLDPIESISSASAAPDYAGIMRANLATLRFGQDCR